MIYFTFDPRPDLKEDLLAAYPDEQFVFEKSVKQPFLAQAEIIVTYGEDLTEAHIGEATNLKWIMVTSAGIEKMPLKAIEAKGIHLTNVRGIHKIPMAESVLAHILADVHALREVYAYEQKSEWKRNIKQRELCDATALIIGPGAIGGEIGRLLQAFQVKTIGCNRSGRPAKYMDEMVTLDTIKTALPKADIVISVIPETTETKHLLKKEHFEAMKDSALFMNFGRGSVVASDVLLEVLRDKVIRYAVCDVFEEEPLPADHPFWTLSNMTVSPHVSSHSSRYLERSFAIFKPNLQKWRAGEVDTMQNIVNVTLGY